MLSAVSSMGNTWDDALVICCSLTFLIVVTILFELGSEKLREVVRNEPMEHIVRTLFSELTVLGFIGLIAFAVTKSGVLKQLSTFVYKCDDIDDLGHRREDKEECEVHSRIQPLALFWFCALI